MTNYETQGVHQLVVICHLPGGPAKVKPTYIFAGNVWYLNV